MIVDKKPDKAAVPDDLGKTKLVHSVIEKQAYYCREDQSVAEAQKIMRERGLQYLPVVDSNLRVVGVVRRHSLLTNSSSNCAFLIANPQQLLPLGKVTFEAKTLGNLKRRNYTAFNLLAALSSVLAADR